MHYHEQRQIRLEVHGDDFTGVGAKSELEWLSDQLAKHWPIDLRGILGPPSMPDVDHSIVILNRLVTWSDKGIELEADPRHVELLFKEVGCEGSKVTTPLVKERIEEALSSEELDADQAAMYRSASMRLAYLSQDRPDLLVLGKELAKGLKKPTQAHLQMLKRGVRYLRDHILDSFIYFLIRTSFLIWKYGLMQIMQVAFVRGKALLAQFCSWENARSGLLVNPRP